MKASRFFLLAVLLLYAAGSYAQSWNDMARWVESSGKYKLAQLAHPYDYENGKVLGYAVDASSSSITVKVKYQGMTGPYTDRYEIRKGSYSGRAYFRRINVDEPWDPFFSAFQAIDSFGVGYENAYYRAEAKPLYDGTGYNNLSKGEKAAFILFMMFLNDYYD